MKESRQIFLKPQTISHFVARRGEEIVAVDVDRRRDLIERIRRGVEELSPEAERPYAG